MSILLVFTSTFVLSFILTPLFESVAWRLRILNYPNSDNVHTDPTPLLGGVAIYLSFMLIFAFALKEFSQPYKSLLIAATIIFIAGLVDDVKPLLPTLRLAIQVVAAAIAVQGGIYFTFLPNTIAGRIGEIILTLVWLVGITNAFNYLDGLNGLLTGVAIINAVFFFIFTKLTGQPVLGYALVVLAGSCTGFFPHNFFRKKIFMGSAGSTWIGFMLAGLAIIGDWATDNPIDLFIPILIFGVPIFDMLTTTVVRIINKNTKNIAELLEYKGKDHFHYKLSQVGLGNKGAIFFIFLVCILLGLNALLLYLSRQPICVMLILCSTALVFMLVSLLIKSLFIKV